MKQICILTACLFLFPLAVAARVLSGRGRCGRPWDYNPGGRRRTSRP